MEKYKGNWYLPQTPNIKSPGILEINKETKSLVLTIYSSVKPNGAPFNGDPSDRETLSDIVLGEIYHRERVVTLYALNGSFYESPVGEGLCEYVFHSNLVFFGHLFKSQEEIKFDFLKLRISFLGEWMDLVRPGITLYNYEPEKLMPQDDKTTKIELSENLSIELERIKSSAGTNFNYNLSLIHNLIIRCKQKISFWDHLKIIHRFTHFLHFAVGEPIGVICCYSGEDVEKEIVYDFWTYSEAVHRRMKPMVFKAQQFDEQYLAERIRNWYIVHEKFSACLSVFEYAVTPFWVSGGVSISHTAYTNAILNIVQAIESFFKKDNDIDYKTNKEQFNKTSSQIISKIKSQNVKIGLSQEEMQFLNNNLTPKRFKSEYPLQNILLDFCKKQQVAISDYLIPDRFDEFSNEVKELRNTLTHINHNDDSEVGNGNMIDAIFNTSQALFYSIVMDKVGFSQLEIKKMLKNLKGFM